MPPVFSHFATTNPHEGLNHSKVNLCPPPVSLIPTVLKEPRKGEFLKLELHTIPSDPNLKTISMIARFFKQGSVEEWIAWRKCLDEIIKGIFLSEAPDCYAIV